MANTYRVDRNTSAVSVPCGMNSILYIGDDWARAREEFARASIRRNVWNEEHALYGVTLSVWNSDKRDYLVKCSKGLT